jgi:hypothetical protein
MGETVAGTPIPRGAWHPVGGGESGFAVPDPVDNNIIWSSGTGSGSVGGTVTRFDQRNQQTQSVDVWPEDVSGTSAEQVKYRFNWEFPLTISPHDHNRVHAGSQYVHVTTDGGNSWQIISPDLTRNDRSKMGSSGGLTPDNLGVEYAGVVFAIAESPRDKEVIWAGTNDGLVQITRDSGKSWVNVTLNIPNLPEWGTVSNIEASRYDAGTAYITVDLHQMNNRDPFVYKTTNFGHSWTLITRGISHSPLSYAHCVREDPVRRGLLFLGTEGGLYVSFDDGTNWEPLQNNLPHAPVYWIAIQERFHDLVLATYGRGFWILDDITPLENLKANVLTSDAYLLPLRDAYRFRQTSQPSALRYDPTSGQNPPYGASINFLIKDAPVPGEHAQLTITDQTGRLVRQINCTAEQQGPRDIEANPAVSAVGSMREHSGLGGQGDQGPSSATGAFLGLRAPGETNIPAIFPEFPPKPMPCTLGAGVNRYWWDLHGDPTAEIHLRTPPLWAPYVPLDQRGWRPAPNLSPLSLLLDPGTYKVTFTFRDGKYIQELRMLKDPHSSGTEADIESQTQYTAALRDEYNQISSLVNQTESIRGQLGSLYNVLGTEDRHLQIRRLAQQLNDKLAVAENRLLQLQNTGRGNDDFRVPPMLLEKIAYLLAEISSSDFPPTTQQIAVAQQLEALGNECTQEFDTLIERDVKQFNRQLQESNIPNIICDMPTQGSQVQSVP